MKHTLTVFAALAFVLAGLSACGGAQTTAAEGPATAKLPAKATCPVSGEEFTPSASTKTVVHEGKTYYMCCPGCGAKFAKAPEKYLAALATGKAVEGKKKPCSGDCGNGKDCADCANPAVAKAAAAPAGAPAVNAAVLPAEATCPVSGKKFKPTAQSKTVVHEGKTYYMCCPGCVGKFAANPQQFISAR